MVAFPRINAPKPAPSRRFSTFSTSSVGSFPRKNRSPTLAPCDPGFHPAIEQSPSLPPCGARKNHRAARLPDFFDRRISSNPCRSASAFGGTNRSPAPQPPRPAPTPNPLPQGRGPKAKPPNFHSGACMELLAGLVRSAATEQRLFANGAIASRYFGNPAIAINKYPPA